MKVTVRDVVFVAVVLGGASSLVGGLLRPMGRAAASPARSEPATGSDVGPIAARVDESVRKRWAAEGLTPAATVPSWP